MKDGKLSGTSILEDTGLEDRASARQSHVNARNDSLKLR